ncbi:chemotaxis protein CheB [Desulfotalea psychrophila]|uniref:protein-glutamate methylesterase n=1 Tax=Desulfotalea psychrophila (strain LSv54 / DSM 12343) TaxID=177439 RepID=Q6AMA5_DESPS|nr:chemotaxis protein CheB [Desulfotalea psychrophila]CAG36520.1 related to MCP-glutamate methylesterase (CheB) [Desulfotalea psychrophila LSv54]
MKRYSAIVIGASAGGIHALKQILSQLEADFQTPILIVQHIGNEPESYLVPLFKECCSLTVVEAHDKEPIAPGTIYFAPPNYHLLLEEERTIALSADERVNFSRPSIDRLFQTAAAAYCDELIGIILTGANSDGAAGLNDIYKNGGLTIVQSPETAAIDIMPRAALAKTNADHILILEEIAPFLKFIDSLK